MHPDPPECGWPESLSSKPFGTDWEFAEQQLRQLGEPRKRNEYPLHNEAKKSGWRTTDRTELHFGSNLESLRGANNTRHCGSKANDEFGFGILESRR
jgi:hypothetical protein